MHTTPPAVTPGRDRRRGAVLLLVLFLMALTLPLVAMLLDTHTDQIRCVHNHIDGLTALYVAEAGVHDAMNELLQDSSWRTGFTDKTFPADLGHSYTVTVTDGDGGTIVITSTGQTASGFTKTVTATVGGF